MTHLTVYVQRNIHRSYNFISYIDDDKLGLSGQQKKYYACTCSKEDQRLDRDSGDSSRELNGLVKYQNDLQSG